MIDGKGQGQDHLDRLLADYFRPETSPADMGRRLAAAACESETALTRLEGQLGIEATPRGISLVRTGSAGKPATVAARKLIEQAREEIHEYLRGQRAFFRVPQVGADLEDQRRYVVEQAFRREDLTRIHWQEIQEAFEPPSGQRAMFDAYPFCNHVAEVGEYRGHDC